MRGQRGRTETRALGFVLAVAAASAACGLFEHGPSKAPAHPPTVAAEPTPPPPLPVDKAPEDVIVAAWAEPAHLPAAGGQAQILV